jgi:hypothetical protein
MRRGLHRGMVLSGSNIVERTYSLERGILKLISLKSLACSLVFKMEGVPNLVKKIGNMSFISKVPKKLLI